MRLLVESFWRAAAYCLHPRIVLLSLVPVVVLLFYWAMRRARSRLLEDLPD